MTAACRKSPNTAGVAPALFDGASQRWQLRSLPEIAGTSEAVCLQLAKWSSAENHQEYGNALSSAGAISSPLAATCGSAMMAP